MGKERINRKERELTDFAFANGATRATIFSAKLVSIDERVRLKCQIPLCPHFGNVLTCPPNVPTVEEFKKALSKYKRAMLVQIINVLEKETAEYEREEARKFFEKPGEKMKKEGGETSNENNDFVKVREAAVRLHKLVNQLELKAMELGYPYVVGLIGGECMLCTECVGVGSGKPCRRPLEARPSMEGVGIDVIKTCEKAGLSFEIPPKKEIVWTGLLLLY